MKQLFAGMDAVRLLERLIWGDDLEEDELAAIMHNKIISPRYRFIEDYIAYCQPRYAVVITVFKIDDFYYEIKWCRDYIDENNDIALVQPRKLNRIMFLIKHFYHKKRGTLR